MSSSAPRVANPQFGALPWRWTDGALEILLITTRKTQRWLIPKGWPIDGLTPSQCAAQEALEEAGVVGDISDKTLGFFRHSKERKSGGTIVCMVHVYALEVSVQHDDWAEKHERQVRWFTLADALGRIDDPGLRRLILKFAKHRAAANAA